MFDEAAVVDVIGAAAGEVQVDDEVFKETDEVVVDELST
jgi:hypothetical protein